MFSTLFLLSTISFVSHGLSNINEGCSKIQFQYDSDLPYYPMNVCMVNGSTSYKYECEPGDDSTPFRKPLRLNFEDTECSGTETSVIVLSSYYAEWMCAEMLCEYVTVEEYTGVTECGDNFIPTEYVSYTKQFLVTDVCHCIDSTHSEALTCKGSSYGYSSWSNGYCYGDEVSYNETAYRFCSVSSDIDATSKPWLESRAMVVTCPNSTATTTTTTIAPTTQICNGVDHGLFVPENECFNMGGSLSYNYICDANGTGTAQSFESEDCSGDVYLEKDITDSDYVYCDGSSCSNYIIVERWEGVTQCEDDGITPNTYESYMRFPFVPECLYMNSTFVSYVCTGSYLGMKVWQNSECDGDFTFVTEDEIHFCDAVEGEALAVTCVGSSNEDVEDEDEDEDDDEDDDDDDDDNNAYHVKILSITFFVVLIINNL